MVTALMVNATVALVSLVRTVPKRCVSMSATTMESVSMAPVSAPKVITGLIAPCSCVPTIALTTDIATMVLAFAGKVSLDWIVPYLHAPMIASLVANA